MGHRLVGSIREEWVHVSGCNICCCNNKPPPPPPATSKCGRDRVVLNRSKYSQVTTSFPCTLHSPLHCAHFACSPFVRETNFALHRSLQKSLALAAGKERRLLLCSSSYCCLMPGQVERRRDRLHQWGERRERQGERRGCHGARMRIKGTWEQKASSSEALARFQFKLKLTRRTWKHLQHWVNRWFTLLQSLWYRAHWCEGRGKRPQ